jgi:uncharacterized protein with FMN-binding domain
LKKRILITVLVIVCLLLIGAGLFKLRYDKMVKTISEQTVEHVDLSRIGDGVYSGSYGDFLVSVSLDVTVRDGSISDIEITDQRCGPGYDARETIDRIIGAQSPLVDAVSGATGSSRCIMISVYRALKSGE